MRKLFTLLGIICLILPRLSFAQSVVRGEVRDQAGQALPGASVIIKHTTQGTITNAQGKYELNAPADAILVFKMLGFTPQEVNLNGRSGLDITLQQDNKAIDEVVVTAIGIKQQKKKLGYATQEVNPQVLTEAKVMNFGNALSGQVAGLTVTNPTGIFQSPSFSLRGKTPLIVVDGIPVESDLYDISEGDIENVNVLKGATASALYGSRGRNGAILITTKNATKEGLEISAGISTMFTAGFTVYPETQTEYGNGSNGRYEFWDGEDGGISDGDMIWGPKFGTGTKVPQWNSPIRNKETGEVIPWWGNVAGTIYDDKSLYERVPTDWVRHDNLNDFLSTGIVTNNNFSVAYKGAKTQYYVSGKYSYQKGQVPNSSLHSGGINFNSAYQLAHNVKLDASLSYNKIYSPNYPRYGYGPKNHMYTILIWMGDDVNGKELNKHRYVPGMEGYRQANYNYAWYNNPYFAAYELEQEHNRNVLDGQLKLNWQILPNLSVQGRAAARENDLYENMKSPKSYMNYGDSRNGDFKMWNNAKLNVDADVLASYSQTITPEIEVTVNAGASSFYRKVQEEYASSDGLIVPEVYSLNNTQGPVQASNFYQSKAIRSVYGSANIDLFNAVFLNVTGRNDWSSTLPAANNSYFYPSVSLSTMVSQYIQMPRIIDYLKLNTSWAQVSSDLEPYSIYATYAKDVTYGAIPSVSYPAGIINPNIKPEKTTSYEAGFAASFAKNRFSLEGTYYHNKDENQIINQNISEASGFSSRKVNGNVYEADGLELVGNLNAVQAKDFSWNVGLNWNRHVRKISEVYGGQKFGNLKAGDRDDAYYATVWQKSTDGKLILDPNSGLPLKDPYPAKLGHLDPSWRLGLQNNFKIRNFRIALDVDGVWGGLIRSVTIEKMWWGGKHPNSVEYRDAEYAAGKPVYVPDGVVVTDGELVRDVNGNVISDTRHYRPNTTPVSWQTWSQIYPYQAKVTEKENEKFANVFDRSYFKLRRLSVSYDLATLMKLGAIKNLDVTLYGYNLVMWKKTPYIDPDYGNDDNLQDPSARYLGFSINTKF